MTTQYTITCGLDTNGNDDRITWKGERATAKEIALTLAAEYFPNGHTIREVTGRWMSQNGPVDEPTVEIVWMATDAQKASGEAHALVNKVAGLYKQHCYQEAVMVTTQEVYAVFV